MRNSIQNTGSRPRTFNVQRPTFNVQWKSRSPALDRRTLIAGYGCARTYAELVGDKQGARLLNTSLQEEGDTDKKLTKLAKSVINLRAKKVPKKPAKEKGAGGTIKMFVKKVIG